MNECIICNSTKNEALYGDLLKCQGCGHAFANLHMYSDEELFKFYNNNYFFGNEYRDYVADKKVIQKKF